MPDWSQCAYVYVAHGKWGHKIGISAAPPSRMKYIKSTLVRTWHRPKDAELVERTAHAILEAHRTYQREWFDVPERTAIETVDEAIERVKAGNHKRTPKEARREREAEREAALRDAAREAQEEYEKAVAACKRHRYGEKLMSGFRMCERCGYLTK
jgi:hypothetical protein